MPSASDVTTSAVGRAEPRGHLDLVERGVHVDAPAQNHSARGCSPLIRVDQRLDLFALVLVAATSARLGTATCTNAHFSVVEQCLRRATHRTPEAVARSPWCSRAGRCRGRSTRHRAPFDGARPASSAFSPSASQWAKSTEIGNASTSTTCTPSNSVCPLVRASDEAIRGGDEIGDVLGDLEPQDVGAEHPPDHFLAPRQHREQLRVGERDVQEQADAQVWALGADHRRGEQQVVVVHPHRSAERSDPA